MGRYPPLRPVLRPALGQDTGRQDPGEHVELPPDEERELLHAMREARWEACGWSADGLPRWAADTEASLRLAMAIAVARDRPWVGPDHLLEALLDDPGTAVNHVIDFEALTDVADQLWAAVGSVGPRREMSRHLHMIGVLADPGGGGKPPSRAMTHLVIPGLRLFTGASMALVYLETEAIAETVRLGHDRTTPAHLLLSLMLLEEQMDDTGLQPAAEYRTACDPILRPLLADREPALKIMAETTPSGPPAAPQRRRIWRTYAKNPPWTVSAARVAEAARTAGPEPAGSAHLLRAILADPDDSGRRLLRNFVDLAEVTDLLAHRLPPHTT
ncbi:hypothetical protein Alo02nite_91520 [Actinoplanes lobatus]|uniref:Clp R domain-containing protein n=1 Tax=Actinoplanes lobatus TaxID=113568 RepID=A0ABQ4AZ46_9ACTN|nr:hypothetical protein Alo02nite_91520 [Actinoplanes lobatus]